jgi:CRISPR/Cas system CSM-associated protein Csm3 (group 7 of RAMP superfamily)
MTEKFFKCTLLSDVVLNTSTATEGNMETLDYIPGSNFLGIVAKTLYNASNEYETATVLRLLHSNEVSYGDATIKIGEQDIPSFTSPLCYLQPKLNSGSDIYLNHLVPEDNNMQLKQIRYGFINSQGQQLQSIKKTFSLKSEQDIETRKSKDGAMFGFEAIKAGLVFIFSVRCNNPQDMNLVEQALVGKKRIGKSKSAEYGQVQIEVLTPAAVDINSFAPQGYDLVYAASHLCFIDENTGQYTYKPTAQQLGFASGIINWNKSSIRTVNYNVWNARRNSLSAQRNCIAKGSVFYVEKAEGWTNKNLGEFVAEGLGRILLNPSFLEPNGSKAKMAFTNSTADTAAPAQPAAAKALNTPLGQLLSRRSVSQSLEARIAQKVIALTEHEDNDALTEHKDYDALSKIPPSQWGNIRALATKAKDRNELYQTLFKDAAADNKQEAGYLVHGVAFDKYWNKNNCLQLFKNIIDNKDYDELGTAFIAKLAAQFAKKSQNANK